jgi:hypothetical protein
MDRDDNFPWTVTTLHTYPCYGAIHSKATVTVVMRHKVE